MPTKDSAYFRINRSIGVVTADPGLATANEGQTAFTLSVEVRDSGFPNSLTTEQKFNVYLAEEFDDDVPAFDDDVTPAQVAVDEDAPTGTYYLTLVGGIMKVVS